MEAVLGLTALQGRPTPGDPGCCSRAAADSRLHSCGAGTSTARRRCSPPGPRPATPGRSAPPAPGRCPGTARPGQRPLGMGQRRPSTAPPLCSGGPPQSRAVSPASCRIEAPECVEQIELPLRHQRVQAAGKAAPVHAKLRRGAGYPSSRGRAPPGSSGDIIVVQPPAARRSSSSTAGADQPLGAAAAFRHKPPPARLPPGHSSGSDRRRIIWFFKNSSFSGAIPSV